MTDVAPAPELQIPEYLAPKPILKDRSSGIRSVNFGSWHKIVNRTWPISLGLKCPSVPFLVARRARWRLEGKKVVFTNGCYDILHPGHIRLLERARSLGDVLILALNTDASVQRLKGSSRPFFDEETRVELALHLEAVDAVILFDEDTPRELIAAVLPDVLVKGADWAHFIAGREEVEAAGGQVFALPLEPGFSTTDIAEKIISRDGAEAPSQ